MKEKGSIILSLIFVLLISSIGFAVLQYSLLHSRISRLRLKRDRDVSAVRNELISYVHDCRKMMENPPVLTDAQQLDSLLGNSWLREKSAGDIVMIPSWNVQCENKEEYIHFYCNIHIRASNPRAQVILQAGLTAEFLQGMVPLLRVPLVINQEGQRPAMQELNVRNISLQSRRLPLCRKFDHGPGWEQLWLELLTGKNEWSWPALRQKIGLEPLDSPIPLGIYLAKLTDEVLPFVFIQGDVDELVFSVDNGWQVIGCRQNFQTFELRYKPGEQFAICWPMSIPLFTLFSEKLLVNGNILSVRGLTSPALGDKADLLALAAGNMRICSAVTGIQFAEGPLPRSSLTLGVVKKLAGAGDVQIPSLDISQETGSITGVALLVEGIIRNESSALICRGLIQCLDLENQGNIHLRYQPASKSLDPYFQARDACFLSSFAIEYLEEVENE